MTENHGELQPLSVLERLKGILRMGSEPFDLTGQEDYIGLYFSAQWCPPCRLFTPQLKRYYETVKKTGHDKSFEVVFISSDMDEESFLEYYDSMPWAALNYSERDVKDSLCLMFEVRGYPTLVILDNRGHMVTRNGRACVMNNKDTGELNWS